MSQDFGSIAKFGKKFTSRPSRLHWDQMSIRRHSHVLTMHDLRCSYHTDVRRYRRQAKHRSWQAQEHSHLVGSAENIRPLRTQGRKSTVYRVYRTLQPAAAPRTRISRVGIKAIYSHNEEIRTDSQITQHCFTTPSRFESLSVLNCYCWITFIVSFTLVIFNSVLSISIFLRIVHRSRSLVELGNIYLIQ